MKDKETKEPKTGGAFSKLRKRLVNTAIAALCRRALQALLDPELGEQLREILELLAGLVG